MPQGARALSNGRAPAEGFRWAVPSCFLGERSRRPRPWHRLCSQSLQGFALFASLVGLSGCRERVEVQEAGAAALVATAHPGVCAGGGGVPRHDAEVFTRQVGELCVDPHGESRVYLGQGVAGGLDEVCVELFGKEYEVYRRSGLERITTLRYVEGSVREGRERAGSVDVTLSRFSRRAGAYGFFTRRVLAGGDPLSIPFRPLAAGAAGALGDLRALVVRGRHVLELAYVNEEESSDESVESSAQILPLLAAELGGRLPGTDELVPELQLLPKKHLLELGVEYEGERLLGVNGAGAGVIGHYRDGDRRWRVLVAIREDEQGAGDLIHTLAHGGKGWPKHFKERRVLRARYVASGSDQEVEQKARVWLLARRGRVVIGIGDEIFPAPEIVLARARGGPLEMPADPDLDETRKFQLLGPLASAAVRLSEKSRTRRELLEAETEM